MNMWRSAFVKLFGPLSMNRPESKKKSQKNPVKAIPDPDWAKSDLGQNEMDFRGTNRV
ncbi:MAG: hypothetical protein KGZ81_16295 [Flavobacteriales bacterium]|nr:hypothetical protein [Flavobacteriales bacterium]MBS4042150.1 hypothetical protein [Flavobacteriales bacterium]